MWQNENVCGISIATHKFTWTHYFPHIAIRPEKTNPSRLKYMFKKLLYRIILLRIFACASFYAEFSEKKKVNIDFLYPIKRE